MTAHVPMTYNLSPERALTLAGLRGHVPAEVAAYLRDWAEQRRRVAELEAAAKERISERTLWRCYHCRAEFTAREFIAAQAHFGLTDGATPACITTMRTERDAAQSTIASLRHDIEAICSEHDDRQWATCHLRDAIRARLAQEDK